MLDLVNGKALDSVNGDNGEFEMDNFVLVISEQTGKTGEKYKSDLLYNSDITQKIGSYKKLSEDGAISKIKYIKIKDVFRKMKKKPCVENVLVYGPKNHKFHLKCELCVAKYHEM